MYCPVCGQKIEFPDASFCPSCGSEIHIISGVSKSIPQEDENGEIKPKNQSINVELPQVGETGLKKQEGTGPYSAKTLAFALVSCGIGGVTLGVGGFINFIRYIISSSGVPPPSSFPIINPLLLITILIVARIAGLTFGIAAKTNGNKAVEYEPENGVQQVGNIFSYIGIIINSIFLVVSGFYLFTLLFL
ncbi:MAG: zinc ribbon domain-containing protein [Promethearchaeota archaeon]|nr:MAG: zinc ribbon domain-containing protein [Candidatus Lokiarchaeota archaeon]